MHGWGCVCRARTGVPGGFNVLGLSKRCKEEEERAGGAERPSRGPEAEREHGARGLGRPAPPRVCPWALRAGSPALILSEFHLHHTQEKKMKINIETTIPSNTLIFIHIQMHTFKLKKKFKKTLRNQQITSNVALCCRYYTCSLFPRHRSRGPGTLFPRKIQGFG